MRSDSKPKACNSEFMRRTNQHVLSNSHITTFASGDKLNIVPMRNIHQVTFPDSDERWGQIPCETVPLPPVLPIIVGGNHA